MPRPRQLCKMTQKLFLWVLPIAFDFLSAPLAVTQCCNTTFRACKGPEIRQSCEYLNCSHLMDFLFAFFLSGGLLV